MCLNYIITIFRNSTNNADSKQELWDIDDDIPLLSLATREHTTEERYSVLNWAHC